MSFLCSCNDFRFPHQVQPESSPCPRAFRSFLFNQAAIKHFTHLLPALLSNFWANSPVLSMACLHLLSLGLECPCARREYQVPFFLPRHPQGLGGKGHAEWGEVGVA